MRRTFFFLLLTLVVAAAHAQIPSGYYNNVNGKTGDELKVALHDIIKGHHVVSYGGLLNAFAYTDCKPNGKIWDIYSNIEYSPSSDVCGEYEQEGDCWNREHTWPQSWFNESTTPRSDLFHVYPTDGFVNGQRSNYPYGEVNSPTYTSGNGSKLGPCVTSGYSGKVFEPIDEYKGDIARGFFYMSVRYYSEDSDWGTSGMTNKSEIKPWAMTMLLRWSDEDPVSDKEIARNNAVYGYQNNRNPFIDHPEYARMIWDESWQGGISYNITCATGLSHGSVSAPESAIEGSTVSITATPDLGYMVGSYNVYKTGSPNTTVTVSSNGTFTMPGYAVTVSATFVQNNNYYDITLGNVSHGTISTSVTSAKSGTTVNLTATPDNGYSLYSWYVFKTGDMNITVNVSGNSFVMPAYDVTVMATFVQGTVSYGDYVKVTSAPADWNGAYLIVYEGGNLAFNGSLTSLDATGNTISVSISNNTIVSDATTNAAQFTITAVSGGYSIQSASGYYIGQTADANGLKASQTTAYPNNISYNNGSINIVSGGAYLRYNDQSGQTRFRYFKSSTYTNQKAIQLYKKSAPAITPTHTIHFDSNGGEGSMNDQTVNEFEPTSLTANTFTREGFLFDGWNTAADGTGEYYANEATVNLFDDLTLYAQWEQLYTITLASVANGSINASPMQAIEETTITLTAIPDSGYELDHWTITYGEHSIDIMENQFDMPASNVTVSACFVYVGEPFSQKYHLVTSIDQLVTGRTYLVVNTQYGKALGTTQNNNNRSSTGVTVNNGVIANIGTDVCELRLGTENGKWTFFDPNYNTTGGYLYAASSSNNYLRTQTTNDDNGRWTISIASNGVATITAQGSNTNNKLQYNNSAKIFSCYSTTQQTVSLFIRAEEYEHFSSETVSQVFPFDKHIIHSDATLTVTGTTACNEPNQLIIEDGAQLIHHNDGVKATFKKNISGYEGNSGWYTIATPLNDFNPSQIATDNFDLYAYDEDGGNSGMEWTNYKAGNLNPNPCDGYLYAHNPGTTLHLSGTLNNGDLSQTVSLSFGNNHETIKGFNLLGNPTAHDIIFSKSTNVADGYYYLDDSEAWVYEPGNAVPAGRGFLVKANAAGQSVTLNPNAKRGETETQGTTSLLRIDVDGEPAYVKLSEGNSMPLLNFRGRHSCVYLSHGGKDYIMLANDKQENIDLCYQPKHDGQHRLTVTLDGTDVDYLHLVDHLTGADIDLLQNPCYNFESSSSDLATRFQLVFNP